MGDVADDMHAGDVGMVSAPHHRLVHVLPSLSRRRDGVAVVQKTQDAGDYRDR